jgi:hypothetical protein
MSGDCQSGDLPDSSVDTSTRDAALQHLPAFS